MPTPIVIAYWETRSKNPFCGRFDDVDRWIQHLLAFGVDTLILVDIDKIRPVDTRLGFTLQSVDTMAEALALLPKDTVRVFLESESSIPGTSKYRGPGTDKTQTFESLKSFVHPVDAAYIVGQDTLWRSLAGYEIREKDKVVTINFIDDNQAVYCHDIIVCALYDRMVKL